MNMKYGKYTPEEDDFLRKNFDSMNYTDMAKKLHRPADGVKNRCVLIGLTKRQGCIVDTRRDTEYMNRIWRELDGPRTTHRQRES
jgi:hypothetical protein